MLLPKEITGRYLTYDPWNGYLNNTRICLETAILFAHLTDRTLVLPDPHYTRVREVPGGTRVIPHPLDVFDPKRLAGGIRLLSDDATAVDGVYRLPFDHLVPAAPHGDVFCFPSIPAPGTPEHEELLLFADGRKIFWELPVHHEQMRRIHIGPLLEVFYTFFFLPAARRRECTRLIREHLVHRAEISELAERLAGQLGEFHAMHIRRSDFQSAYPRQFLPIETIAANVRKVLEPGARLYLSTDETDRTAFDGLGKIYELVFREDVLSSDSWTRLPEPWVASVEQLVCACARRFVGTRLSTFSAYITRLRGYRSVHAPQLDTAIYFTDGEPDRETRPDSPFSWFRTGDFTPLWGREFREGWAG